MRSRPLIALLAVAAAASACSSDGPTDITPIPDGGVEAMPDEAYVSIRMVDFGTNIVHIGNSGAEKGEVGLLRICQNSVCTNETVNELEISAIVPVNGVDLGELDEAGGEVALFQEEAGGSVLLSYVTWGEGEKEHLELASEQGLWSAGESLDGGDKTFIQARQPVPDGPGDWVVAR